MRDDESIRIPLDILLLAVLTTAHVWFNQVSSALAVTRMAAYVLLNRIEPKLPDELCASYSRAVWFSARLFIVLFSLALAAVLPTMWSIAQRRAAGGASHAHDCLFQTKAAIEYFLAGKNPSTEDYRYMPMGIAVGAVTGRCVI